MHAAVDRGIDAMVIRLENLAPPCRALAVRNPFVARDRGGLGDHGNRACRGRRAVAVDHQPRIALCDQMRIEQLCESLGDASNADVPADVPDKLAFRDAEIAQRVRQHPSVMIRGEQEGRSPLRILLMHGRSVALAKQLIGRLCRVQVHSDCL